jgi:hypothetical protein
MNDWRSMQADTAAWQEISILSCNDWSLFFELEHVG